jgi:repressor LexA
MKKEITKRQSELLRFIYKFIQNSGYPPTLGEMREKLEVASNQAVLDLLKSLETKNLIKRETGDARGIKITTLGCAAIKKNPLVNIAGVTAAGPATEAIAQNEWLPLPSGYKKYDNVFIVQVSGSSMIEANIYDGDSVLIKEQKEYKSGDIVLARIGDDVTLKTFIAKDGKVHLKPENPACRIIAITEDTYFLGKMIANLGKR